MSRRMEIIREAKRREFEQKQQVNKLYAEKIAQGMTPAQAATGFSAMPQNRLPNSYVVSDGDTLDTISKKFNMTPQDVLDKNPEVKTLQTGMVVDTSAPRLPRPDPYSYRIPVMWGLLGNMYNTSANSQFWQNLLPIKKFGERYNPVTKKWSRYNPNTGQWDR